MPNLRNSTKGDSNPGSLDCESGVLPLSYRTDSSVLCVWVCACICVCMHAYVLCMYIIIILYYVYKCMDENECYVIFAM